MHEQKKHQPYDLVFIRHAESEINKATKAIVAKNNIPNSYKYLKQFPQWTDGVKYSMNYVDCSISEQGKIQCTKKKKKADELKPSVILVSPLWRTLQTCDILFGDRDIPIFVEPILTESIRSSCDLASDTKEKVQRYKNYNFQSVLKEGDNWNFQYDYQNGEKYLQQIHKKNAGTVDQKNKVVLDYMKQNKTFQTPHNVRARTQKVKQLIKKYKQKYGVIVVVAHFNTINYTIAKQFDQQQEPVNSLKIHNCQFHFTSVKQITS